MTSIAFTAPVMNVAVVESLTDPGVERGNILLDDSGGLKRQILRKWKVEARQSDHKVLLKNKVSGLRGISSVGHVLDQQWNSARRTYSS